ncbi:LOW QUALITY PROTEIN: myosin light chain kinase 2, skeletal/cardiac muscle [Rhinophrynus dorsalis]
MKNQESLDHSEATGIDAPTEGHASPPSTQGTPSELPLQSCLDPNSKQNLSSERSTSQNNNVNEREVSPKMDTESDGGAQRVQKETRMSGEVQEGGRREKCGTAQKPAPGPPQRTPLKMPGASSELATDRIPRSPEGSDRIPQSPEGSDRVPQSPTIIIGENVFQIIDDCPPPPAPFPHRFVTLRPGNVSSLYDLNMDETLGGGRFGEVHICTERSSGLQLVAKVLKVQSSREREMAVNEIQVMNQLDHRNLIQMYDALEAPDIFLFLEYVEGGELFERIIDDNYQLMEVDAMVYVRQICEGIFYMHQMYVLHLDLKFFVETPSQFSAEFVDNVAQLMPPLQTDGIVAGPVRSQIVRQHRFARHVVSDATDVEREIPPMPPSGRMSAAQCLRHPWLNDLDRKAKLCNRLLKSQIELRKYMMRRRWKKNVFAVTAANRLLKISSSGCLTSLAE